MNRSLFQIAAHLQLALAVLLATGCTPTQPFFVNESPDLQHYLNASTSIEYPDVDVDRLPETTQALPPLTIGNHDYQFWNLTLEECINLALNNAKIIPTTGGTAEQRQSISSQIVSSSPEQLSTIYDIAITQSTTQSVGLTTDGNGNRLLPRGAVRANQIGGVEDALAEFDAVASGFIDTSTTDRPQNVGAGNTINQQISVAKTTTQQAALSKRMATGGVATLRQQIIYSRNNTPITDFSRLYPSDYTAIIEAQVQHPLMRNRGTFINRIPVVLASLNEDISIAQYESQIRNLVRDVEVAYWDLYLSYRNVAASRVARDSALATARFAKLNYENGLGTIQELSQAEGQYHLFNARLHAALAGSNLPGDDRLGVYGRERDLRAKMGLAATDGRLIRPIEEPTTARVEYGWNEAMAQMLYLSPELRQNKYQIKQAELELALAKNQILPQVDLSLLVRWVGLGDTLGPPSRQDRFPALGSSALGELTSGDFTEAGFRLEISQPVGVRREMTRIQAARTRVKLFQEVLREKERHASIQLSDAIGKAASHFQLVQLNAQRWQVAEQEVEARLVEYSNGVGEVNLVLQSQERLSDAQLNYYRALTEYSKSLNFVDFLKGTLLANSNITLREGPWNSKAYCDALERARERAAGYELQYGVTRPGVVRRGPVQNAEAAANMAIVGDGTHASLSDQTVGDGEVILQNPAGLQSPNGTYEVIGQDPSLDPPGLNLQPYREPVPVDDIPLNQMGTPHEMFSPDSDVMPPAPVPDPTNSILDRGVNNANGRESRLNAPSVSRTHYQVEPPGEEPNSGAPLPVRRKPIPAAPQSTAPQGPQSTAP